MLVRACLQLPCILSDTYRAPVKCQTPCWAPRERGPVAALLGSKRALSSGPQQSQHSEEVEPLQLGQGAGPTLFLLESADLSFLSSESSLSWGAGSEASVGKPAPLLLTGTPSVPLLSSHHWTRRPGVLSRGNRRWAKEVCGLQQAPLFAPKPFPSLGLGGLLRGS